MAISPAKALEIFDMGLDLFSAASFLPQLYNKFIGGKPTSEEDKEKLLELIKAGKTAEALEQTVNSWTPGLSDEDEMRLLRDVCYLVHGDKINAEEGYTFFAFLENASEDLRTRFRETYITDKDPAMRWAVIVVLAKLPDDEQRMSFLVGAGLLDPTLVEKFLASLHTPIDALGDLARAKLPQLELNHSLREMTRINQARNAPAEPEPGSWAAALRNMFKFKIF